MDTVSEERLIAGLRTELDAKLNPEEKHVVQVLSAGATAAMADQGMSVLVAQTPEPLILPSTNWTMRFIILQSWLEAQILEGMKGCSEVCRSEELYLERHMELMRSKFNLGKVWAATTAMTVGSLSVRLLSDPNDRLPFRVHMHRLRVFLEVSVSCGGPGQYRIDWLQEHGVRMPLWFNRAVKKGEAEFLPNLRAHAIFAGLIALRDVGQKAMSAVIICVPETDIYRKLVELKEADMLTNPKGAWFWEICQWHGPETWNGQPGPAMAESVRKAVRDARRELRAAAVEPQHVAKSRTERGEGFLAYHPLEQFLDGVEAPPPAQPADPTRSGPARPSSQSAAEPAPKIKVKGSKIKPSPELLFRPANSAFKSGTWTFAVDTNFILRPAVGGKDEIRKYPSMSQPRYAQFVNNIVPGIVAGLESKAQDGVIVEVVWSEVQETEMLRRDERQLLQAWDVLPGTEEAYDRLRQYEDDHPQHPIAYGRRAFQAFKDALTRSTSISVRQLTRGTYAAFGSKHRSGLIDEVKAAFQLVRQWVSTTNLGQDEDIWQAIDSFKDEMTRIDSLQQPELHAFETGPRQGLIDQIKDFPDPPPELLNLLPLLSELGERPIVISETANNDATIIMDLLSDVQGRRTAGKEVYGVLLTTDSCCAHLASHVAPAIITAPNLRQKRTTFGGQRRSFGGQADTRAFGMLDLNLTDNRLPWPTPLEAQAAMTNIMNIAAHQLGKA